MNLLLVTACDRVLDDTELGTTLVSIFHQIKIQVTANEEVPTNAVIPREWSIFTKFALDKDEEGREYSLDTSVFWPDGSLFAHMILDAKQPTQNGMAFKVRLTGFPIGQPGKLKIVQSINSGEDAKCGPFETDILVQVEKSLPPNSQ